MIKLRGTVTCQLCGHFEAFLIPYESLGYSPNYSKITDGKFIRVATNDQTLLQHLKIQYIGGVTYNFCVCGKCFKKHQDVVTQNE